MAIAAQLDVHSELGEYSLESTLHYTLYTLHTVHNTDNFIIEKG